MIQKTFFRRYAMTLCTAGLALLAGATARATSISFAWDPSPSSTAAGYKVYYGTNGSDYSSSVDAGNATNLTVSNIPPGNTYYFSVLAYDASNDDSAFANQVSYVIPDPPTITTPPYSMSEPSGQAAATFNVGVSSSTTYNCQWYFNGQIMSGATATSLHLTNLTVANQGSYNLLAYNAGGSVTSPTATLTIQGAPVTPVVPVTPVTPVAPVLSSQPASQTANIGSSPQFSVNVQGSGPFTFQWYFNGKAISGANKATLHLSDVTSSANAGTYYVIVQSSGGSVTSSSATLTVINAYASLAGYYNGLFYQTNSTDIPDVTEASGGMLHNCRVGTNGAFSGQLILQGYYYPMSGTFNASGQLTTVISRASNSLPNLSVIMQMDMSGQSKTITGVVSNNSTVTPWTSALLADIASNALPVSNGVITMLIPPVPGSPNSPTTSSSATITVNGDTATVTGTLADTMGLEQVVNIAPDGTIPLFFSLYSGNGVLEGWVNLANGHANGMLSWVRPAGLPTAIQFPLGFTNIITIGSGTNIVQ